jgi:protein tyrosine/serine phosphatase
VVVTQAAGNGRWVELEGAANVRDLGGLPLAGGGTTAAGVVLRADNLQELTGRDVARLVDELGVRLVVDLRTRVEVDLEGPGPLVRDGRVEVRRRSLYPEAGERTDVDAGVIFPWRARDGGADASEPPVVRAYLGYLRDRPDSIVAALRDAAGAPGATLVHCAAGKDRTGVVAAFALAVAGVRRDAIVADYVATEERLARLVARLRASPTYGADLRGRTLDSHRPRAETMARVLELVDERHGGPVGWLAQHGFDAAEAAALRARLTRGARGSRR